MIGRADIEGSKSDVAMNAWPPQASYPCGNFSDTSCFKLRMAKRIDRPRFRGPYSYWKSGSSRHLPFCSTGGFCPPWASLRTPALSFDRCTAPVKLPIRQCPQPGSRHRINSRRKEGRLRKLGLGKTLQKSLREAKIETQNFDSASPPDPYRDGSRFNARIKRDAADGDRERSHPGDRPLRFTE